MSKVFYWLKLKKDFFTNKAMKKLRKIAGGDTYTVIYLKLMLSSLNDDGYLYYDGVEPTFSEEVALALDEDAENVKITLSFLESVGLLIDKGENTYFLTQVPCLVGSETDKAEIMRRKRQRERLENGNNVTAELPNVTERYTEIEKEIDKEKEIDTEIEVREKRKRFSPPTLEEVQAYCIERGNNVDAQHFVDHYTSNGWLVGKNKMRDWKAAVRTWEKNNYGSTQKTAYDNNDDLAAWASKPESEVW